MNRLLKIARLFSRRPRMFLELIRLLPRSRKNRRRLLFGSLAVLLVGSVVAEFMLPPRDLPWHALAIDDRAGFSTDLKLAAIGIGPASWCDRLIGRSEVLETTALDPHDGEGGCGWSTAVHLDSSNGVTLSGRPPYAMRCPLAAGAHIWLTSVDYRAREILGTGLTRIHHAGTFACRRMYNRSRGPMSEHAYANAWDVTGFELADGRVVSVQKHWNANGPLRTFLRAARDDACKIFRVVLGPDYNEAHHDHLHVDMGGGLRCR
ncbi:MAG: extensin family protein [Gammaproteobacteria bacterium]|nr:extensin family protein [Gammaproteobacteria bacterium]